jgi:hypothetical protein
MASAPAYARPPSVAADARAEMVACWRTWPSRPWPAARRRAERGPRRRLPGARPGAGQAAMIRGESKVGAIIGRGRR